MILHFRPESFIWICWSRFSAADYVDDEEPDDEGTKLDLAYDFYS